MSAAGPGARLEVRGVTKRFGTTTAVDGVSLGLAAGSFTALLGPSGCGKSTLLGVIAGLLPADAGEVVLDATPLTGPADARRDVGLVFQTPLLFPHLSVQANVAFGLRMRRLPRRTVRSAAGEMLERVQLSGLADRRVTELSGGQEQRVALARALVLSPRLLLLDEPFSQLDAELRADMRALVRRLTAESSVTTLFVTHDQAEAVEIADDIALMLDGRLTGHGMPELFYTRPPSLAAARFFGVTNELAGDVCDGTFTSARGRVSTRAERPDGPAVLVVRPESVRLGSSHLDDVAVRLDGTLIEARFAGTHLVLRIDTGALTLTAHVPLDTRVEVGARVVITAAAAACTVLAVPSAAGGAPVDGAPVDGAP